MIHQQQFTMHHGRGFLFDSILALLVAFSTNEWISAVMSKAPGLLGIVGPILAVIIGRFMDWGYQSYRRRQHLKRLQGKQ